MRSTYCARQLVPRSSFVAGLARTRRTPRAQVLNRKSGTANQRQDESVVWNASIVQPG